MAEMKTVPGILDVIKSITSNGESGRLDISSFGTHGTLLFNEGKLVDARLESLSGFQAVNAAVSLRNVEFSFDHVAPVAHASTITPPERIVLQHFFGIEAAEVEEVVDDVEPNWNAAPEQVVPLTEVEEIPQTEVQSADLDLRDTPTVEVEPPVVSDSIVSARPPEIVVPPVDAGRSADASPSVTAAPFAFLFRPPVAAAVCLMLLVGLVVAATALRSKFKARQEAVAVASVVKADPSAVADAQSETSSSVADAQRETRQVAEQSATQVAEHSPPVVGSQQQNTSARKQETSTQRNVSVSGAASPAAASAEREPAVVMADRRKASDKRDANVQDLTGEWRVINTVDKTTYKSFGSMQVGFRLKINQRGKEFTARGEKFSENGQTLPAKSRTPIQVKGSIEGDQVVATFIEEGRMRRTNGRFVWRLERGGDALAGTFVTTAANSSGRSAVTKQ